MHFDRIVPDLDHILKANQFFNTASARLQTLFFVVSLFGLFGPVRTIDVYFFDQGRCKIIVERFPVTEDEPGMFHLRPARQHSPDLEPHSKALLKGTVSTDDVEAVSLSSEPKMDLHLRRP